MSRYTLKWPAKKEKFSLTFEEKIKIAKLKHNSKLSNKEVIANIVGDREDVPKYYYEYSCTIMSQIKNQFKKIARNPEKYSEEHAKLLEAGIIRKR